MRRRGRTPRRIWRPSPQQLAIYAAVIRGDKTQRQIARESDRAESTISELVARIDRWLAPQYMDKIREIKANHTSRLMYIYTEHMREWVKSKKVHRATKQSTPGKGGKAREVTTVEVRSGDPRQLAGAMAALNAIREIWGMNSPEKIEGETTLRIGGLSRVKAIKNRMEELAQSLNEVEKLENGGNGESPHPENSP
jgi:predicted transcriptional regulator